MSKDEKRIKKALEEKGFIVLEKKRDNGIEFSIIDDRSDKTICRAIISHNRFIGRLREGEYRVSFSPINDNIGFISTFSDADELINYINEDINYLNS